MLGVSIFAILIAGLGTGLLASERAEHGARERVQAALRAEQMLEAVRSMSRQINGFASVSTPGTYHVANANSTWSLEPGEATTADGFTESLVLATNDDDDDVMNATANVAWNFDSERSGSISVQTQLARFMRSWASPPESSSSSAESSSAAPGGAPEASSESSSSESSSEIPSSSSESSSESSVPASASSAASSESSASSEETDAQAEQQIGSWNTPQLAEQRSFATGQTFVAGVLIGDMYYAAGAFGGGGFLLPLTAHNLQQSATAVSVTLPVTALTARGSQLYVGMNGNHNQQQIQVLDQNNVSGAAIDSESMNFNTGIGTMGFYGDMLVVGTDKKKNGNDDYEFVIYQDTSGTLTKVSQLQNNRAYIDSSFWSHYVYMLAKGDDEIRVYDIANPASPQYLGKYNTPGKGLALTTVNGSLVLGRNNAANKRELFVLRLDATDPAFLSTNSNPILYQAEVGGDVNGIAVDPTNSYAFLATGNSNREFQIFTLPDLTLVNYYNLDAAALSIVYDASHNEILISTATSVYRFRPS